MAFGARNVRGLTLNNVRFDVAASFTLRARPQPILKVDGGDISKAAIPLKTVPGVLKRVATIVLMPSRIWGPLTVMGIFALAGALIGADIALWPSDTPMSLPIPIAIGSVVGFVVGVFVVWVVRRIEEAGDEMN